MDKYFYFRTVADQDADDGIDDSLCLPVRQIRSINPSSDTAITISFDILNVTQGKVKEVLGRLVEVMNASYPAYSDGFVTIADDVTTTYLTSSAAADETVVAQYIHPDITSCGAITIAAANS